MRNQPPIYVINLAKDTARMASMARQLTAQGLQYERIEAVNGRELTAEQRKVSYSPFWGYFLQGRALTNAELGCSLSHRKIWQLMIERGQEWAVIFEDDAELLSQFSTQMQSIENETYDFEMIQLYGSQEPDRQHHVSRNGEFNVMLYSRQHKCTAAYIMRLRGAKKLLKMKRVWTIADKWTWLSAITGLRCCGIMPYPVKLEAEHEVISTVRSPIPLHNNLLWKIVVMPILRIVRFIILKIRGI